MIGIDIVDLNDPLIRSRKASHMRFIKNGEDLPAGNTDFWDFWTAKEAIFKAKHLVGKFNPREIPVHFDAIESGTNHFISSHSIIGFTRQTKNFVLAIAYSNECNTYHQVIETTTKNPSQAVRNTLQQWYLDVFGTEVAVLNDKYGLPYLEHSNTEISFSHHGKYLAFGLKKP